jgi:hypothetical protein
MLFSGGGGGMSSSSMSLRSSRDRISPHMIAEMLELSRLSGTTTLRRRTLSPPESGARFF